MVSSSFDIDSIFNIMKRDPIPYIPSTSTSTSNTAENLFIIQNRFSLVEELHSMCMKTHYREKRYLFYKSLLYLDIIMYEALMNPSLNINFNLIVLNALSLGIKFTQNQINIPRITQLQHLSKKYNGYSLEECLVNETLCVKLMKYRLVYLSCYDYLEMFFNGREAIFTKAKDVLDRIALNRIFIQKHPYVIACNIVSYTFEVLCIRDMRLQKKFICDKHNQFYQIFVNIVITTTPENNTNKLNQSLGVNASSSLSSSCYTRTSMISTNTSANININNGEGIQGTQRDFIYEKYTRIRQASKNIEMIKTSELKQLIDITQGYNKGDEVSENGNGNRNKDIDNKKVEESTTVNGKKTNEKREFKQLKDYNRNSCINVFTSANISKRIGGGVITFNNNPNGNGNTNGYGSSKVISNCINNNSNCNGNTNTTNKNGINYNNYNSVFQSSNRHHPQSKIFDCLSDKKGNNLNIDLSSVSKFNIRHAGTFNFRSGNEVK